MSLHTTRLYAIGGSKGGTGKSFLTAAMAMAMARMGKTVVAVDAHLGSPGLHALLGLRSPRRGLVDAIRDSCGTETALCPTPETRLALLPCTADVPAAGDASPEECAEMLQRIQSLNADYILMDLGTGRFSHVLDFFLASDRALLTATPDAASIQSAFGFLSSALHRRIGQVFESDPAYRDRARQLHQDRSARERTLPDLCAEVAAADASFARRLAPVMEEFRPLLVLNLSASEEDRRTAAILQSAVKENLGVDLPLAGVIPVDESARRAARTGAILDLDVPVCAAAGAVREILRYLLESETSKPADPPPQAEAHSSAPGLNENLEFMGRTLHVQTEDMGAVRRLIETQVFLNGRVLHSVRSPYPEDAAGTGGRDRIMGRMREQHIAVIREIQSPRVRP